jgi:pimeloyl-ACP methyl ester carboxylesterase
MVLVDSSHEDQDKPGGLVRLGVRVFQASGLHRWVRPASSVARYDRVYASTRTSAAVNAEFAGIEESAEQVRRAALSLGTKPLVVITAGLSDSGQWHDLQMDLLSRSSASRRVVATNSGHGVHEEQPALVTTEIRKVVDGVR